MAVQSKDTRMELTLPTEGREQGLMLERSNDQVIIYFFWLCWILVPEVTLWWFKLLISPGISILDEHQGERVLVNLELIHLVCCRRQRDLPCRTPCNPPFFHPSFLTQGNKLRRKIRLQALDGIGMGR